MCRALFLGAMAGASVAMAACGESHRSDERQVRLEERLDGFEARLKAVEGRESPAVVEVGHTPAPVVVAPAVTVVPAPPKALTDAARQTERSLRAQRMTFHYTEADPPAVVANLVSNLTGLEVSVSPRLPSTPPVTLQSADVNAYDALEVLAAKGVLRWSIDEAGAVKILAPDE